MKRIFIVLVLMISQFASADEIREIEERKIFSEVLNEELSIFIQLPLFYKENHTYRYPVLYLLDAPVGITLNSGILDPLVGYNNAPQFIIVGLSSNNRDRDFTPSKDENYGAGTGGADTYLRFIETEAIPFVEENFRTEGFRVFSGHSYGGLLITYAFYAKPNLFNAHFAFSPSLFWDDLSVAKSLVSFTNKQQKHHNMLYINIGNEGNPESESAEGKGMLEGVKYIDKGLRQGAPTRLRYKIDYYPEEPHQVTQIIGTYKALRHLYPSWDIPYKAYLSGYEAVAAHFASLSEMYGYTIQAKDWQLSDAANYELGERNNPAEAIKYMQAALAQHPDSIGYKSTLAMAYEKNGELSKALKLLKEIVSTIGHDDNRYAEFAERINKMSQLPSTYK